MPISPQTQHDWTVHSINIHGIFFERWCQQIVAEAEGWHLDSVNYPVEFPPQNGPWHGKESTHDIRASRDVDDLRLCLLIECKKNNPEFVDWIFFQKPNERSSKEFIVSEVGNTPRDPPAQGWNTASVLRHLISNFPVADEARETRANYLERKSLSNKTKTSNSAIQDAAYQVSLAKQAVVHEDSDICQRLGISTPMQLPWRRKLYFPTIVTTASLYLCEFDPKEVDPGTGEIVPGKAMMEARDAVVFEYPLPRHLQFSPGDIGASYKEGIVDLFTRLHIMVVQSRYFPTFLRTFYGSEEVPTNVPSPLPERGPEAAQPAATGDAPQAARPWSGISLSSREIVLAISEKLCWEVLRSAEGKLVSSVWLKGEHSNEPPLQNAVPLFELERDLVLRYSKNQIEDSLYFLEKRGYLIRYGFQGLTRVAFQLSVSALAVLKNGTFTNDEQQAFREALLDLKQPGLWGMKFNVGEAWRRIKKWRS